MGNPFEEKNQEVGSLGSAHERRDLGLEPLQHQPLETEDLDDRLHMNRFLQTGHQIGLLLLEPDGRSLRHRAQQPGAQRTEREAGNRRRRHAPLEEDENQRR